MGLPYTAGFHITLLATVNGFLRTISLLSSGTCLHLGFIIVSSSGMRCFKPFILNRDKGSFPIKQGQQSVQRHRYRFIFKDLEHESNVGEVSAGLLLIYRGFKHTSSFLGYQKESYAQTEI